METNLSIMYAPLDLVEKVTGRRTHSRTNSYPATASAELLTRLTSVTDSFVPLQMAVDVTVPGMSPEQAAKGGQEQMEQLFA
jgi:hypothetical protein